MQPDPVVMFSAASLGMAILYCSLCSSCLNKQTPGCSSPSQPSFMVQDSGGAFFQAGSNLLIVDMINLGWSMLFCLTFEWCSHVGQTTFKIVTSLEASLWPTSIAETRHSYCWQHFNDHELCIGYTLWSRRSNLTPEHFVKQLLDDYPSHRSWPHPSRHGFLVAREPKHSSDSGNEEEYRGPMAKMFKRLTAIAFVFVHPDLLNTLGTLNQEHTSKNLRNDVVIQINPNTPIPILKPYRSWTWQIYHGKFNW